MTKPNQNKQRSFLHSAGVVGLMTLLSRLTGLVVQRMVASRLGVSNIADAYQIAYLLPNLLRRIAAENTMTAAFLPTLVDIDAKRGQKEAKVFVADFFGTLIAILLVVCALCLLLMTPIIGFMMLGKLAENADFVSKINVFWSVLLGRAEFPEYVGLSVKLGRVMFPYLMLISITSAMAAVLNMRQRFALTASTSIFGNLIFIFSSWTAFLFVATNNEPRYALIFACAMLLHGLIQVLILLPAFKQMGFNFGWMAKFRNPDVQLALKRMLPGIIAGGIHPINVVVSQGIASGLGEGAQTVLGKSNLLGELVLGLFAVSVATVSLPTMSRLVSKGDLGGVRSSLGEALRGTALLAIPSSIGMAVLATPIVAMIFQTGKFGADAVAWTSATLPFQALGLIFIASARISTQALNAMKDYRGPAMAAGVAFAFNVTLSLALMKPMETSGMALANSLSAIAGLCFLAWRLNSSLGRLPVKEVAIGWLKMGAAAILMGFIAWLGGTMLNISDPRAFLGTVPTALRLLPLIAICAAAYFGLAMLFRVQEAKSVAKAVIGKLSLSKHP